MHKTISISKDRACRILIVAQHLHKNDPFGRGQQAVLSAIRHLGYVQMDTISVVERAHHHVLWSRVKNYTKKHIHRLQKDRQAVFEYWSHALSYLPMEDFRFSLPIKTEFLKNPSKWYAVDAKTKLRVLNRIRDEGPLMARDFQDSDQNSGGWFEWKPAKRALQKLFMEGTIMVAYREKFQKYYDLTERIVPDSIDQSPPSLEEYADYLIDRFIQANGLGKVSEITYLRKGMKRPVAQRLQIRVSQGELLPVLIKKVPGTYYTRSEMLDQNIRISKRMHLLSPFDNLIIQRARLIELFDFDYQIECYVPPEKRNYGYFSLPILFGTKLIGRIDLKADRSSKELIIQSLHWEDASGKTHYENKLNETLTEFAKFNACETIR